jgi:hypothetical protein
MGLIWWREFLQLDGEEARKTRNTQRKSFVIK